MKTVISGILAGISISIGGTVYLLCDSKLAGAIFFSVGLFSVCVFGFSLFTGRVCYVFDQDRSYATKLPMIQLNTVVSFNMSIAQHITIIPPVFMPNLPSI